MRVDHFAIWCADIEKMRHFYCTYFGCTTGDMYHNTTKDFKSYFLTFSNSDCRLELMTMPNIEENRAVKRGSVMGLAHFCLEVGDEDAVLSLTEKLRSDGYTIASEPRRTGDGYFESAVLDPEGNYVEMSAI